MSTFGTMKARIASELERPLTNQTMSSETFDDVVGQHINDACKQFRPKHWWFLQSPTAAALTSLTTANDSYVAEFTGLVQLDSLRITINGYTEPLYPISFNEMESRHDGTTDATRPYEYTRFGGRIRLYPTPSSAWTLTWSGLFDLLSGGDLAQDSDTNAWMVEAEKLIRSQARLTLLRDYLKIMEDVPGAQIAVNEAIESLDREHMRRMPKRRLKARC